MFTLIKTPDPENKFDLTTVTIEASNELDIDQLCGVFEDFVKACGFSEYEITAELKHPIERGNDE